MKKVWIILAIFWMNQAFATSLISDDGRNVSSAENKDVVSNNKEVYTVSSGYDNVNDSDVRSDEVSLDLWLSSSTKDITKVDYSKQNKWKSLELNVNGFVKLNSFRFLLSVDTQFEDFSAILSITENCSITIDQSIYKQEFVCYFKDKYVAHQRATINIILSNFQDSDIPSFITLDPISFDFFDISGNLITKRFPSNSYTAKMERQKYYCPYEEDINMYMIQYRYKRKPAFTDMDYYQRIYVTSSHYKTLMGEQVEYYIAVYRHIQDDSRLFIRFLNLDYEPIQEHVLLNLERLKIKFSGGKKDYFDYSIADKLISIYNDRQYVMGIHTSVSNLLSLQFYDNINNITINSVEIQAVEVEREKDEPIPKSITLEEFLK